MVNKKFEREKLQKRRNLMAIEKSKLPPQLASKTIGVCRQGDSYFLDTVEIWLHSKHHPLYEEDEIKVLYLQYCESIKALHHNVNFVLSIQNFGTTTKKGNIINLDYLRRHNFEYNADLRSIYSARKSTNTIKSPDDVSAKLIKIFEDSQQIIERLDAEIEKIREDAPSLEDALTRAKEFKNKIVAISNNIIIALENNIINLQDCLDEISFAEKSTQFGHIK